MKKVEVKHTEFTLEDVRLVILDVKEDKYASSVMIINMITDEAVNLSPKQIIDLKKLLNEVL